MSHKPISGKLKIAISSLLVITATAWSGFRIHAHAPEKNAHQAQIEARFQALYATVHHDPVIMIGDSITAYDKPHLKQVCGQPIINLGVYGSRTDEALGHIDLYRRPGATQAIVMYGINDIRWRVKTSEILSNYEKILASLVQAGIKPRILSTLHAAASYPNSDLVNAEVDALNSALRNLSSRKKFQFADVQPFVDQEDYAPDHLHIANYSKLNNFLASWCN